MLPTQHVNTAANEEEEEEDDDDDDDEEYEDGDEEEEESELGTTVDSRASHLAQTAKTNGSRLTGGGRGDVDDSITYTNNENGTHQHVSEADQGWFCPRKKFGKIIIVVQHGFYNSKQPSGNTLKQKWCNNCLKWFIAKGKACLSTRSLKSRPMQTPCPNTKLSMAGLLKYSNNEKNLEKPLNFR